MTLSSVDGIPSIDGISESVNDVSEELWADWDIDKKIVSSRKADTVKRKLLKIPYRPPS